MFNDTTCSVLIIVCTFALGIIIAICTSQGMLGGKVRANMTIYIAYCLLIGAYTILLVNDDDTDDDDMASFV